MTLNIKKLFPVLLAVVLLAAVCTIPAFAQDATPPLDDGDVLIIPVPVEGSGINFDMGSIADALQALIAGILIPSLLWLARFMSAKSTAEVLKLSDRQKEGFRIALHTWIFAAEQMNITGYIDGKLTWVTSRAELWLEARRLPIDLDEIRAEIEAIVAEELNFERLLNASK